MESCKKVLKKFHLASKTLGQGGQFWLWRHSIAKNVRCGRDYICAKFYALIPFCSIFTEIWWAITEIFVVTTLTAFIKLYNGLSPYKSHTDTDILANEYWDTLPAIGLGHPSPIGQHSVYFIVNQIPTSIFLSCRRKKIK